jgi:predicted transcriptional regulator
MVSEPARRAILIRLAPEDHNALQALAQRRERSITAEARLALRAYLRDNGHEPTLPRQRVAAQGGRRG